MSIRIMSAVWQDADADGGKLLLLLALADHAGEDGTCWPGVEKLAHMARLSVRHTRRLLGDLEAEGQIEVIEKGGGRATNRYRVVAHSRGEKMSGVTPEPPTPAAGVTPEGTPTSPEPSENRQGEPSGKKESKLSEDVGLVWAYYVEVFSATRQTLDPTRTTIIRNALKVRTIDECKRAIDGLSVSPFHNGDNEQKKKYLGIRYALKGIGAESNDERIDKMMDIADEHGGVIRGGKLPTDHPRVKRHLSNVRTSLRSRTEMARGRESLLALRELGYDVLKLQQAPWVRLIPYEQQRQAA